MEYKNQDLQDMLCTGLRITLEYLCVHAHLRELFQVQELLSLHAAQVAWQQSQQAFQLPKDCQELPAVLRDQLDQTQRSNTVLKDRYAQPFMRESPNVPR